ncbi:HXXEE domain-containing protein [Bacillus manliponensis]|uniref:HXXEE domain-containing protein n=1 Tax=Bacillus manliponensis TaxID=574376 RepID=UPI003518F958
MKLNRERFSFYFWFIPIVFAFHNAEEYYFFPKMRYLQTVHIEESLVQEKQFLVAIILLTIVVFAVICIHYFARKQATLYAVLLVQSIILMNAFVHSIGAIVTKGYVPGLMTAFILIIPFSILFFREGIKSRWWKEKHIIILSIIGLLLMVPVIIGTLLLAKLFI